MISPSRQRMRDQIIAYLQEHPRSRLAKIATALQIDVTRDHYGNYSESMKALRNELQQMRASKIVYCDATLWSVLENNRE